MTEIVTEWRKEKYKVLLEAGVHAINRARYVFLAINVAGVFVLLGLFNATFPWLRNSIERAKAMKLAPDHLQHIQKTVYQDLWTLTSPILGIKISVFDLAIIGSSALFILAVWQYYCVRRENNIVHIIRAEARKLVELKEFDAASYLYHGIAHYFVFTTRFDTMVPAGQRTRIAPTRVVQALILMPVWIPLLILLSEVITVASPYKLALDPQSILWYKLSSGEQIEEVLRMLFCLGVSCWSAVLCVQALKYDKSTRKDLEFLMRSLNEGH